VQKKRPVFEHTLADIRAGNIPQADPDTIAEVNLVNPDFKEDFTNLTNALRYVMDGETYEEIKRDLDSLIKTAGTASHYFKNYLKPIYAGMDSKKSTLGSRASIEGVMDLVNNPVGAPLEVVPMEGADLEEVIQTLEGMEGDLTHIRPERKTIIFEAWHAADKEGKARLFPYLMSDIDNPNDPVSLKFALFEALTSTYPVQLESIQSLEKLKDLNREMYDQLVKNPSVQFGVENVVPDNLVKIVNDFKMDATNVISDQITTDEKLAILKALDVVIEGLTPILPPKIITEMTDMITVARDSVNNVRAQGGGVDLLGFVQNSADYRGMVKT
jgi:uncharacterized protein YjeT (DUF2065 family)